MEIQKGLGVSEGVALGRIYIKQDYLKIAKESIHDRNKEIERFFTALEQSYFQIEAILKKVKEKLGIKEGAIFEAQLLMLKDPELIQSVIQGIEEEGKNAEWAVTDTISFFIQSIQELDNEYMKERIIDMLDVSNRIVKNLMGIQMMDLEYIEEPIILISNDLAPTEIVQLAKVAGIILEKGGETSHVAIIAKSLGLPLIIGAKDLSSRLHWEDVIAMDGATGEYMINPDKEWVNQFLNRKVEYNNLKKELQSFIGKESRTKDGKRIEITCNIGSNKELESVLENDGEGIGLYRSEFIYGSKVSLFDEEEQFNIYKEAAERMNGKPVVIRTLDIGGDKNIPGFNLPKQDNPFMGYRGIRVCLKEKELFKTQLRALLRASFYGNIKLMFPMISSMEELIEAKQALEEVKEQLRQKNSLFNENIKIGIMIEVPSMAIITDLLVKEVDFLSIGTNDLIQYLIAVDRSNRQVGNLYTAYHPAVLRLIKIVVDHAHRQGIKVSLCGEAAKDMDLIPILIGIGLDSLSMTPTAVLATRKLVASIKKIEMQAHVEKIMIMSSATEVKKYIHCNISKKIQ